MSPFKTYLGIDLGGTKIAMGLVQDGDLLASLKRQTVSTKKSEDVIQQIGQMIEALETEPFEAIGVGVPGLVDKSSGVVYDVYNIPALSAVNLKTLLEEKFNVPVYIQNDANCFALGEFIYGRGQKTQHMVGLTIGTGLGAGIVCNNRLVDGNLCAAGEFGCMPYQQGVIEDYVSGSYFKNEWGIAGEIVFKEASAGEKRALDAYAAFGQHLGYAINQILFAFAPEMVVIGGAVAEAFPFYESTLRKELETFPFKRISKALEVVVGTHKEMAMIGAASLCQEKY